MNYTKLFFALFMALLASCSETNQHKDDGGFDRQAHRGGRGLMPETQLLRKRMPLIMIAQWRWIFK